MEKKAEKFVSPLHIPVFLIAADDIAAPMCVTMASILANTKAFIEFYILERSSLKISPEKKERIEKLRNRYSAFSIEYIEVNPDDFAGLAPTTAGYIPNDTYFRYIIPELKPEIKKAVYLDVDIVVKKDIADLYCEKLGKNYIGAVNHPAYCWKYPYFKKVIDNLNLRNPQVYVNGGVIVFDCERCRCNNITARLFAETVRLKDKILWADQDIFNLVFEGKIKLLPKKYNALRSVYENERQDDVSVVESWYIIHYNGKEKPWNASPYFKSYFWEYAEKTDFYTDLKEHLAASYSERIEVHEKHISFILRKINEYDTQGVKSMADRHIPFILGRINAYDHKEKVREDNHSEKKYFLLNLPLLRIKCSRMKKKYYLFSIIPLLKIVYKHNRRKFLLFGFIPFAREKVSGAVKMLICGARCLWRIETSVESETDKNNRLFDLNKRTLGKKEKIKIYFLFHSEAFWPSWKSFWKACLADERVEAKMIYCPVKPQNSGYEGQFVNSENWLKSQDIPYVKADETDWSRDKPHVVVMQTPYDEYHRLPCFRSDVFRKSGIRVVYISYGLEFTEDALSIYNHFKLPLFSNAWRIYKFSDALVRDYKKYCPAGNRHVVCVGHPKFDALLEVANTTLPHAFESRVGGRKVVVWHTHFPCNYSYKDGKNVCSTFSWENDLKILELVEKNKDLFFVFMPHHLFFGVFENVFNISKSEIYAFKKRLELAENCLIWTDSYPEILRRADAFMGERSAVTMEMLVTGKPVLYLEQVPEVYNAFGKAVISSYYYAADVSAVEPFLQMVKNGEDPKKQKRMRVKNHFLHYLDGKCGERIKDDIIRELKKERFFKELFAFVCRMLKM